MQDDATSTIFSQALNIVEPWYISSIEFSNNTSRIDIYVAFVRDSTYSCPNCKHETGSIHDVRERTWRHLNFFQYCCYIHCTLPRVYCKACHEINDLDVPWARKGSRFTKLMEGMMLLLTKSMTYNEAGEFVGEDGRILTRVINHYVNEAHNKMDCSNVSIISIDETSTKKGHNYITVFADLQKRRVIYATEGKSANTIDDFLKFLVEHNGNANNIHTVCTDMSPAYVSGITSKLPESSLVIDKFHLMQIVNKGVNKVRRQEIKENEILKKTHYIFLKNPKKLTEKQQTKLNELKQLNLKTVNAYHIKLGFLDFWKHRSRLIAKEHLETIVEWMIESNLKPMINVAATINYHEEWILNYFKKKITNGFIECVNGMIQKIKRDARGFRNLGNLTTLIYHRLSNLDLEIELVGLKKLSSS